jgi:hypothetical protein
MIREQKEEYISALKETAARINNYLGGKAEDGID